MRPHNLRRWSLVLRLMLRLLSLLNRKKNRADLAAHHLPIQKRLVCAILPIPTTHGTAALIIHARHTHRPSALSRQALSLHSAPPHTVKEKRRSSKAPLKTIWRDN
uniref:Secreted protein n=1 Tax=Micrurus lemniscatus lemniscatus TaxID=129467 RepID=A0A2D4HVJ8_MICLE